MTETESFSVVNANDVLLLSESSVKNSELHSVEGDSDGAENDSSKNAGDKEELQITHHGQKQLDVEVLNSNLNVGTTSKAPGGAGSPEVAFSNNGFHQLLATPPSPSSSIVEQLEESTPTPLPENTNTETMSSSIGPTMPIMENANEDDSDDDEKKTEVWDAPLVESIAALTKIENALSSDDDEKKDEAASSPLESSIEALTKIDSTFTAETTPEKISLARQVPILPLQSLSENMSPSRVRYASPPGRRSIQLRLLEETSGAQTRENGFDTPFKNRISRRFRSLSLTSAMLHPLDEKNSNHPALPGAGLESVVDRGVITVSWYEGTTSTEMHDHVWNCVLRKLNSTLQSGGRATTKTKLEDVRLLDENVTPHQEVVLCPFLPDGSQFLLRFRTVTEKILLKVNPIRHGQFRPAYASRAPDSPSAEPSPFNSTVDSASMNAMNAQQLQVLNAAAAILQPNGVRHHPTPFDWNAAATAASSQSNGVLPKVPLVPSLGTLPAEFPENLAGIDNMKGNIENSTDTSEKAKVDPSVVNSTDQLIEQQLRQLNELFLLRRTNESPSKEEPDEDDHVKAYAREEKRQVIFVISNYLVLFMSLIALSAEIQSRLPQWMAWVQDNYDSVQNCTTDNDALFECVSNGDFSGLVASFLLWATQSAAAKRIFLFGFDSPKRLWNVVYEALVSAVCWGTSYIFIRRGLNPNTRQNFLQTYWKDAVYGSLAGFNAAFMKAVLKNLIPQEVALEALESRQAKIYHWLGALMANE